MPKKRRSPKKAREYEFKITAYSPDTFPLARLAEYLHDLAVLFGEDKYVHLIRLKKGSTSAVFQFEREAEPKVRERLRNVRRGMGPPEAIRAADSIDEKARKDNANGLIIDPGGSNLLIFPGCDRELELEYGPIHQAGSLDGVPIMIGGEHDPVSVHLESRQKEKFVCRARRSDAKRIALFLWNTIIRVEGTGRWIRRGDGTWRMLSFTIENFKELEDISLEDSIQQIRAIPAKWKTLDDPLAELKRIRHGPEG